MLYKDRINQANTDTMTVIIYWKSFWYTKWYNTTASDFRKRFFL